MSTWAMRTPQEKRVGRLVAPVSPHALRAARAPQPHDVGAAAHAAEAPDPHHGAEVVLLGAAAAPEAPVPEPHERAGVGASHLPGGHAGVGEAHAYGAAALVAGR